MNHAVRTHYLFSRCFLFSRGDRRTRVEPQRRAKTSSPSSQNVEPEAPFCELRDFIMFFGLRHDCRGGYEYVISGNRRRILNSRGKDNASTTFLVAPSVKLDARHIASAARGTAAVRKVDDVSQTSRQHRLAIGPPSRLAKAVLKNRSRSDSENAPQPRRSSRFCGWKRADPPRVCGSALSVNAP